MAKNPERPSWRKWALHLLGVWAAGAAILGVAAWLFDYQLLTARAGMFFLSLLAVVTVVHLVDRSQWRQARSGEEE